MLADVEDFVYLSSSNSNGCTLPESFYYCSLLLTLHLTFYCFDYGAAIKWKSLKSIKLELVGVSSVVNAKLTFYTRCTKDVHALLEEDVNDEEDSCKDSHQVFGTLVLDYLQKLSCAIELTIGTWFIEVMCMLQLEGVQIPEMKCKYLMLEELDLDKLNLFGVAGLLRALPHVETLNIDFTTVENWISSFEFPNLKYVKIVIPLRTFLNDHTKWGLDKLYKLSEFLLTNAKVLKKFVSISKRTKSESSCGSKYLFQLADKLICCPRSSINSIIMFFQE
ncbi:hypothetical protein RDI58_017640 [Solanum bulbocastanum]|uniref:FBD domain-containing protein n=1 Tax=Solanum bulbocastanum TaxID=147425 RepID=A0AAN8TF09_SOLBU